VRGRPAALAVAAALALAACGGSEQNSDDASGPTTVPTVPTTTTPTATTPATTTPEATPSPYSTEEQAPGEGDGTGGAPAPSAPRGDEQTGGARPPEDSPENDTAPDPDSPAGRYERFCDENPGACD
jgi:hypothetical protein